MDANITSFHVNRLAIDNVFFRAFQDDQNLFAVMAVDGEFSSSLLLDEANQDIFAEDESGFGFVGQGNVRTSAKDWIYFFSADIFLPPYFLTIFN